MKLFAAVCMWAFLALPAAALAAPAEATAPQPTLPVQQSTPLGPNEVRTDHVNYGSRTLAIVLASSAVLIALGGVAYAVHIRGGGGGRHPLAH